ncbi:uncharacterized protein LOC127853520 [Dreissena polymorpha]|uniref:Uncharacterized protein n=1 Tax=Dreissena polymorpha TaxID=45954 RepID=A0A9D4CU60_DREPO|nr:uncharacterized protein LOC127853520 [Dreissena polymorpha]KAH3730829.1 hypothetical protein DPMN_056827 [Dreissena polymorpha]
MDANFSKVGLLVGWLLLKTVAAQIFNQASIANFYIMPPRFESVFDPASFNVTISTCHESCGDQYFNCFVDTCQDVDVVSNRRHSTDNDVTNTQLIKLVDKPGFVSRFLYYLSFGLVGRAKARVALANDIAIEKVSSTRGSPRMSEKECHDACQQTFRICHKDCICKLHPSEPRCQPPMLVFPDGHKPAIFRAYGATGRPPYKFDWTNIA